MKSSANEFESLNGEIALIEGRYFNRPKKAYFKIAARALKRLLGGGENVERTEYPWFCIETRKGGGRPGPAPKGGIPKIPKGGSIRFDIDKALRLNPATDRIALVFFMGIGDYFYATRFIEDLKAKYPAIPFEAWVSQNTDGNNSPLVGRLLENNPNFERVNYYDGRPDPEYWMNYDYGDCLAKVGKNTLAVPMLYRFEENVLSRYDALCDTFMMERPKITPPPKVYLDYAAAENAASIIEKIDEKMRSGKFKGVAFLQLTCRSNSLKYPHTAEIAGRLMDGGYLVLSVEDDDIPDDRFLKIDIRQTSINDSIKILEHCKKHRVFCLTIVSCFWAISAGLKIPNLGMQHYFDINIRSVWFPNIYVAAHTEYKNLPKCRTFLAGRGDFEDIGGQFIFSPEFMHKCFLQMAELENA